MASSSDAGASAGAVVLASKSSEAGAGAGAVVLPMDIISPPPVPPRPKDVQPVSLLPLPPFVADGSLDVVEVNSALADPVGAKATVDLAAGLVASALGAVIL